MNVSLIDLEETVKRMAITATRAAIVSPAKRAATVRAKVAVPLIEFPHFFIVAPGLFHVLSYPLEAAPPWAFDAWIRRVAEGGIIFDDAMAARLLHIDRERWNIQEKWAMINALAEAGIALPLFSREEALNTLKTMEVQGEQS